MAPYNVTARRIDRLAEVKDAIELDVPDLAHGSLVCATIAKGFITDIDVSAALRVSGVVSILTHQNLRPSENDVFEDKAIGAGVSFSPLADDAIVFNGQPIALIIADTPETACFASSLVRVEYDRRPSVSDEQLQCQEHKPIPNRTALNRALLSMPLASTVILEGQGTLLVDDHARGARDLDEYLNDHFCSGQRPGIQVMLAVRAALALQRSVRLVLTRQQVDDFEIGPRSFSEAGAARNAGRRVDDVMASRIPAWVGDTKTADTKPRWIS
jgi:xanthine dehydrogenase YagR molybdenum-binding subunit